MKYKLDGLDTVIKLRAYMIQAMEEMHCCQYEIDEYLKYFKRKSFDELIEISRDYIDMLNSLVGV
jgi:phosphosulfolactate synthase (CoM biosynthesis protein A)